jgi:type IV secretion/conjugal transfer VirB4 family ATPase
VLRIDRIGGEHREAGSLNSLLAVWGFVDDATFLTKAGHVGAAYHLDGIDPERLTHDERAALVHGFAAALRLLDEHCRVYQYLIKRTIEPIPTSACANPVASEAIERRAAYLNAQRSDLYELTLYLVLLYEPPTRARTSLGLRELLRAPVDVLSSGCPQSGVIRLLDAELDAATTTLHQKAAALEVQLTDFGIHRLDKQQIFRLLRELLNLDRSVADASRLTRDVYVDFFASDSAVDCHRDHLVIGNRTVSVMSLKEPPSHTFAHMLADLHAVPGEFIACLEWQRVSNDRMRRELRLRRRHFFNKRVSLVNYVAPGARPEEMLVDDSATATVQQLGDALTELEVNGHFFGNCSLTLVLHGEKASEVQRQAAEAVKAMAAHDGSFFKESYNLLNAWLATIPGNAAHNLRRLALLETNCADLGFLFTVDSGSRRSSQLSGDALAIFETPHRVPYAFNPHVDDVGHTLILGATGSGKSFLVNFLITHAQKYDPMTVVLDLGHSYRKLTTLLRGRYLELGLRQSEVTINPFALSPTPENLHFLHAFVRVLIEGADAYRLSAAEDRETYEAIENLYVLEPSQRRLLTLANLLPRNIAGRLHNWIEGGRYGTLFDNVDDTLNVERLQVFDFEAMRAYPALLEPLLFYVLHRVIARVQDATDRATFKLCVMDEAWRFIQHPTLRAYVQEGLKTWRKHNAAMVLSTQTIDDFASVELLRTVVESCPTKLLLANPSLDLKQYAELFQLNETELQLLANLLPRRQLLLKRPNVTKVLTLSVDPRSYWIYTNTPVDNDRVAAMFREYGFADALDRLAASA